MFHHTARRHFALLSSYCDAEPWFQFSPQELGEGGILGAISELYSRANTNQRSCIRIIDPSAVRFVCLMLASSFLSAPLLHAKHDVQDLGLCLDVEAVYLALRLATTSMADGALPTPGYAPGCLLSYRYRPSKGKLARRQRTTGYRDPV